MDSEILYPVYLTSGMSFRSLTILILLDDGESYLLCSNVKFSVDITVSANLQQPTSETIVVQAGESYTFILDELQTLVLYSTTDTTGTKVISNEPLSVIGGQFGFHGTMCDLTMLYEQC